MVGDRASDFTAAKEANMPSIGVGWGYGDVDELAFATTIVYTPSELPEAIKKYGKRQQDYQERT
ncbi:MAG: HAD hydrolase-like protein [Sedimentisphaerales bacterium]|nr:HAD hydrolase-like protein [Sedimentisphaerales bacterium]